MTGEIYGTVDPVLYPNGASTPAAGAALSWSAVTAGTIGAIALSLTLLMLGSAFGLATVSPWPGVGAKPETFTIGAGIWLVVTQWLVVAVGATALTSLAPAPADVPTSKEAIDAARKVAATFAAFTGLSLVIGAFIASVAGVIGGRLRDMHP